MFIGKESKESITDKAVIELMFLNGLRISEVLNVKAHDIMWNGLIKIKGLKGSDDRYCISKLYSDWWLNSVAKGNDISRLRSRYYYHRLLLYKGMYYPSTKKRKRIVTHVFRHLYVRINKSNNISMKDIQFLIGHKSINSTLYYHEQREKRI
jgi:site-specific recombinase XerD